MISKALLPLLSASYASAYFAETNNAHVEFVATSTTSETAASSSFTVDSNSLKHHPSHLKALEDALESHPLSIGFSAPRILELFEAWMIKFKKEYETVEERERLLIFLDNHGE